MSKPTIRRDFEIEDYHQATLEGVGVSQEGELILTLRCGCDECWKQVFLLNQEDFQTLREALPRVWAAWQARVN